MWPIYIVSDRDAVQAKREEMSDELNGSRDRFLTVSCWWNRGCRGFAQPG